LATLDPKYTRDIAFYIVGQDPTENIESLEMDRKKQGYPWPVAKITGSGLRDLKVFLQSTKIAINGNGVITYRDGFGQGNLDKWQKALEALAISLDQK
jgi:hypothetical protein